MTGRPEDQRLRSDGRRDAHRRPTSTALRSRPPWATTHVLPAAGAPLRDRRPLGAEGRVLAVAGVEPRLVGEPGEQLMLHVVDELGEPLRVPAGVPDPTRESRGLLEGNMDSWL